MPTKTADKLAAMVALSPGVKPVVNDIQSFHRVKGELEDCVRTVCMYQEVLDTTMVDKLQGVVGRAKGHISFDISEVDRQYNLFLLMQRKVTDPQGILLSGATIKEIGTVVSSMNSLVSLFLKAQKDIDAAREEAKLKDAVLSAIRDLDPAAQARFFEVMGGE